MSIFTWFLGITDLSAEEKAARSSWSAPSGASNADIVDEAQRRGFLSPGQADEVKGEARRQRCGKRQP